MSNDKKKLSLDDIFNDDEFGLLETTTKTSNAKTADQRLVDAFEGINAFVDKNSREPSTSSMSEYGLLAILKNIRENDEQKISLKPYDRHNLLGDVEIPKTSIDDVLNDDELGLLDIDRDLSIFKYRHIPKEDERAETDFVAQRKSMKEAEFKPYEEMFQRVHKEIKEGKRKILPFSDVEQHLKEKQFYLLDGLLLYVEEVKSERDTKNLKETTAKRKDGRTTTIFENGTKSNMLYRSLSKNLYAKKGKLITNTIEEINSDLYINAGMIKEEDIPTGRVYILKSKSQHPSVSGIKNLYKIGFSTTPIEERIKNVKNEATYLFADVTIVESNLIYNRNANKLEQLLHRFFASACLNIDLYNSEGQRATPREWFIVPLEVIREAIKLIINEQIINYQYDVENKIIVRK